MPIVKCFFVWLTKRRKGGNETAATGQGLKDDYVTISHIRFEATAASRRCSGQQRQRQPWGRNSDFTVTCNGVICSL